MRYLFALSILIVLLVLSIGIVYADQPGGRPPANGHAPNPHPQGNVDYGLHKGQHKDHDKDTKPSDPPSQTAVDPPTAIDPPTIAKPPTVKTNLTTTNIIGTKEQPPEVTEWYMSGGGIPQAD